MWKVVAIDYHGKTDKSFLVNLPDVYIVHQILVPVYYKTERGNAEISSDLTSLAKEEEEAMSVVGDLHTKVYAIKEAKRLPPVDYSVSIYSRKIFKVSDPVQEIVNASCRFGFTIVLKDTDFDTVRLTSFKSILKNLNAEKTALIIQNNKLEESNRNIRRQKKQFKKVVVLFLAVIACGFGLYLMNVNLSNTQYRLERANSTIYENESLISNYSL